MFPVEIKTLLPELYDIQFNPVTLSECLLSVTYDNNHISGSANTGTVGGVLSTTGAWELYDYTSMGAGSHSRKLILSQILLCAVFECHKATTS